MTCGLLVGQNTTFEYIQNMGILIYFLGHFIKIKLIIQTVCENNCDLHPKFRPELSLC